MTHQPSIPDASGGISPRPAQLDVSTLQKDISIGPVPPPTSSREVQFLNLGSSSGSGGGRSGHSGTSNTTIDVCDAVTAETPLTAAVTPATVATYLPGSSTYQNLPGSSTYGSNLNAVNLTTTPSSATGTPLGDLTNNRVTSPLNAASSTTTAVGLPMPTPSNSNATAGAPPHGSNSNWETLVRRLRDINANEPGGSRAIHFASESRWPCGLTNFHFSLCFGMVGFAVFWTGLLLRIYLPHEYFA